MAQDKGVSNDLERAASVSPEEMREFASDAVGTIKTAAKEVGAMVEKARKESDSEALECLMPRYVTLQSLVQVAEGAKARMEEALQAGDQARASHEYRKIWVALRKAENIRIEADDCYGSTSTSGKGGVRWTGGTGEDADTNDDGGIDDGSVGFDPPNVSPSGI